MIRQIGILCFAVLISTEAFAQFEDMSIGEIYGIGGTAYAEGDAAGFLEAMTELTRRRPYQFAVQYNYTVALAMAGQSEAAIEHLEYMANLGLAADISADEDFASLRDHPRFAFLAARLALNNEPEGIDGSNTVLHEFDLLDVLAEGVAIDEATGDVFVSTVRSGEIYRRDHDGAFTLFADGTAHPDLGGILGMAVDRARGLLWAASSTPGLYRGTNQGADTGSGLFAFDLATGEVAHAFVLEGEDHFLGDVMISSEGGVYASDSGMPILYVMREDLSGLDEIDLTGDLINLQGFDFAPGGRIYLADYVQGLFLWEADSGEVQALEIANDVNPTGIDGLFYVEGDLIGIQNATNPKRIVRFELSDDGTAVAGLDVLVSNHPLWDEPTLGQVLGDQLIYMGTSEWPDYRNDGTRREGAQMDPIRIMSVDLN